MQKSINNKRKIKKNILNTPQVKQKSSYRSRIMENSPQGAFPKNANEFRHILEDIKCCKADVEFMLELRRQRNTDLLDKVHGTEPTFYSEDLQKHKNRYFLKPEEKTMLNVNLGQYKYILSDRSKYAINDSTFKYEVKLRTEPTYLSKSVDKIKGIEKFQKNNDENNEKKGKKNLMINLKKWDPTNIHKNADLFNTLLPPILPQSKAIFAQNERRVGRPIIIKKKEAYINGIKIKSRIFDYNYMLAFRYPSDHLPNSRYCNDYGVGNLGEISHLLKSDTKTMTNNWYSYLRGIKKKTISPEDIKKTEQKLHKKSNEKSNFKF